MLGLLERLRNTPVLLADGAWGSVFIEQGLDVTREPADAWNLRHPERVRALALDYAAHADILTTNTFGANRIRLAHFDLEAKLRVINGRGVEIAREAGEALLIAGGLGPARGPGVRVPIDDELQAIFEEQATCLLEAGADFLLLESMTDLGEACIAVRAARRVGAREIVCSFAFRETAPGIFETWSGDSVEAAITAVLDKGADLAGANCVPASESLIPLIESLHRCAGGRPLWLKPNAGQPRKSGVGPDGPLWHYPHRLLDDGHVRAILAALGRGVLGGCCGTTPLDIAVLRRAIDRPGGGG